jgi:uroporphyrinogen decarboxylase
MNNRERFLAIMNYQNYDRLPVVHFGYWRELLAKWAAEGHISQALADNWSDGNLVNDELNQLLGWDFEYPTCYGCHDGLMPAFETEILKELPDGSTHIRKNDGTVVLQAPDAASIPAEIDHLLKDRESWEKEYKWRLQWTKNRVLGSNVKTADGEYLKYSEGGMEELAKNDRTEIMGIGCGSAIGVPRNILGLVGLSYMTLDDPGLLAEIIETFTDLTIKNLQFVLERGFRPDFGAIWEDICFKSGPLVTPAFFAENIVPQYQKITSLLNSYGTNLVSVDCDGMIDELVPLWLEGGVNIMFPIEVGTWHASIAPWRKQYGQQLRGAGGVNKHVMSMDKTAVDKEIERIKPLVELGGYLPCPDHRLPPETDWNLVKYYIEKMKQTFS